MHNLHIIRFIISTLFIFVLFLLIQGCSSDNDNPTEPSKDEPNAILSPDLVYFGQIPQGQPAAREFLIYNNGKAPLVISEIKIEGTDAALFSVSNGGGDITVPVNKIQSFAVNFNSSAPGNFNAQVSVTSNAASSPDVQPLNAIATSMSGGIVFERIIGSFGPDTGGKVRQLTDGGFIVAGRSYDQPNDENVATLFRLDPYGNLIWQKQYPVAGIASFSGVVVTASGNFVCTGSTQTGSVSNSDIFSLATDDNGNILWQEIYEIGGTQPDDGHDIIKTTHGGFMICGSTKNTDDATGGVKDAILLKIDNNGAYEWHKLYGTREGEEANSIQQTREGGYIFIGSTTAPSTEPGGDFDYYLVKTDPDGRQLWSKTFGGSNYDFGSSIVIDQSGDYVFVGYTASIGQGARDYWLIKTDTSGTKQWDKTFGGSLNDTPSEIVLSGDDGFLMIGTSASFSTNGSNDMWVIKTDNNGTEAWNKLYGGEKGEGGASAIELADGLIFCGSTSSYSDNNDLYILRTDINGSIQ